MNENELEMGVADGTGRVAVEQITFPYRAVVLRLQLDFGLLRIPFEPDVARALAATLGLRTEREKV